MSAMGSETTAVAQGAFTILTLSMSGLAPGDVMIMGTATANGMLDYNFMLDLGIEKMNKPPTITIDTNLQGQEAEWEIDGLKFTLNGNVIDPDGQEVTMTLSILQRSDFKFQPHTILLGKSRYRLRTVFRTTLNLRTMLLLLPPMLRVL